MYKCKECGSLVLSHHDVVCDLCSEVISVFESHTITTKPGYHGVLCTPCYQGQKEHEAKEEVTK